MVERYIHFLLAWPLFQHLSFFGGGSRTMITMIPKSSSDLGCVFSSTEVVGDDGTTTIKITMPTLANIFTHQLQFPDKRGWNDVRRATKTMACLWNNEKKKQVVCQEKQWYTPTQPMQENAQNAAFEQMKRRKWKKFNLLKISKPIKSPPKWSLGFN